MLKKHRPAPRRITSGKNSSPCEANPSLGIGEHIKLAAALKSANIEHWPHNALRHSFASYHLARFKDAAALALEMGHTTTTMIFKHYRQVVEKEGP